MEQQVCLNPTCGKPIEGKEGKRAKKYCNDACRASHWSKLNKKGQKWVKREVYEELLGKYETLLEKIKENNKPENLAKILSERNEIVQKPYGVYVHPRRQYEGSDELPKPGSFYTKQLSNPFNLPYSNEGKEEAIESAAKEKKPPVIKDKAGKKPIEDKYDIMAQIEVVKKTKMPDHIKTDIGRNVWRSDQQKLIQELRNKLK